MKVLMMKNDDQLKTMTTTQKKHHITCPRKYEDEVDKYISEEYGDKTYFKVIKQQGTVAAEMVFVVTYYESERLSENILNIFNKG